MVESCLKKVMGEILVTDGEAPESACARLADFCYFAGKAEEAFLYEWKDLYKREGKKASVILVPVGKDWEELLSGLSGFSRRMRYATRKGTVFDRERLAFLASDLPEGIILKRIDEDLYEQCKREDWSRDLVRNFETPEVFLKKGLGVAALRKGEIVAGCSSYSRYPEGIEIEVDTRKDMRRNHLALSVSAKMILACLSEGLYPSWDAMNRASLSLSEKLGYEFSRAYPVFMPEEVPYET